MDKNLPKDKPPKQEHGPDEWPEDEVTDPNLPKDKPPQQEDGPDEWPEDDVAEKYIQGGGKKETPTAEEDEETQRVLKEQKQPKK